MGAHGSKYMQQWFQRTLWGNWERIRLQIGRLRVQVTSGSTVSLVSYLVFLLDLSGSAWVKTHAAMVSTGSVAQLVARPTPDRKAACSSHVRVNFLPGFILGVLGEPQWVSTCQNVCSDGCNSLCGAIGSASDSRSEGCVFKSYQGQLFTWFYIWCFC